MSAELKFSVTMCTLLVAAAAGCRREAKCGSNEETLSRLTLGMKYLNGEGMPKDEKRAFDLFTDACNCGESRACANLGMMYEKGSVAPKDGKRAVDMYTRACESGFKPACTNLGYMCLDGTGMAKDEKRAAQLFESACDGDGGDIFGCFNAGQAWARGDGVVKDEKRAARLFQKACVGGYQRACDTLGSMFGMIWVPGEGQVCRKACPEAERDMNGCCRNRLGTSVGPPSAPMASIAAGDFMRGSNDGEANEKPVRHVHVDAFEMDVTEVTVAAYGTCVAASRCSGAGSGQFCNWGVSGKSNHPINCVDWEQAAAYCAWAGKRLPTESEWEYAARGTDGRKYPWGNAQPSSQLCWKRRNTKEGTCAVGSFPAGHSPFGLQDMAGNVWEWTSSLYAADYGPPLHVFRGGCWVVDNPSYISSTVRSSAGESNREFTLGFRCAR